MNKKTIFKIIISMFLVTSILQLLLNYIINEQILSRMLFGVDYNTYFTNYYQDKSSLLGLISGEPIPYEWVFVMGNAFSILICVIILFFIIKKFGKNNKINKKEFNMIMRWFSILTLYEVIVYIILFFQLPLIEIWITPIIYIVSAYILVYKMIYQENSNGV